MARSADLRDAYAFPVKDAELDFRPLLTAILNDRIKGRDAAAIARAFQRGVAQGTGHALRGLCSAHGVNTVVLSGGVFQNQLLLEDLRELIGADLKIWVNAAVPPNDGGISLGRAAIAAIGAQPRA